MFLCRESAVYMTLNVTIIYMCTFVPILTISTIDFLIQPLLHLSFYLWPDSFFQPEDTVFIWGMSEVSDGHEMSSGVQILRKRIDLVVMEIKRRQHNFVARDIEPMLE